MKYEYYCKKCEGIFEKDFPFAKCPSEVLCDCGESAARYLGGGCHFILKGSGWPGKTHSLNREMTSRNDAAGKRMRKTWGDSLPKLVDQR